VFTNITIFFIVDKVINDQITNQLTHKIIYLNKQNFMEV